MARILQWWVAGAGLALLACTAPQAVQAPSGGEVDAPKFGGVLNTVGQDFSDFDMVYQGRTVENVRDHGLVYDRLLAYKKGPGVEFVSQILEPELAERWEVSSDARVFTYYLRPGVKFADVPPVNGRELASADVKWSMEYYSRTGEYKDKKLPISQIEALYEGLDAIETPDRSTVRVRFKEPFAPFLNYSASQWMPIAARETFKADESPPRIATLVGTGPYIIDTKNSLKDNRWVFTKHPTYWGGPKPYLDSIRRLIIPDESTRKAAFQTKQIDILASSGQYQSAQEIKQNNPEAIKQQALNPGHRNLFISQLRPGPTQDIRVRRAISLAMDRDEYNKVWSEGNGTWALTGSFPGLFTDAEAHEMLKYDPEQAKRLLAEAGYASGLKLEFLPPAAVDPSEELIQAQLKRVGIDVFFTIAPREQNRARLYAGEFDLRLVGGGSTGDGDFDSYQFAYHSASPQNWSQIRDPELDKLVVAQRREADPQKRRETQRAVVRRINDMAWNPGYIFAPTVVFSHPYVKNFGPHWTVGEQEATVWLDK